MWEPRESVYYFGLEFEDHAATIPWRKVDAKLDRQCGIRRKESLTVRAKKRSRRAMASASRRKNR